MSTFAVLGLEDKIKQLTRRQKDFELYTGSVWIGGDRSAE